LSASTHHTPALKHHFEDLGQQHACERLGIWMFLATEVLFFGGIFGAYAMYRIWYPHDFEAASSHLNRTIATVNTVLLITSSLTMTLAIRSAKLGERGSLYRWLLITAALGTGFMVMKGFEYAQDFHEKYVPGPMFRQEYAAAEDEVKFLSPSEAKNHTFSAERQPWSKQMALANHGKADTDPGYVSPQRVQLFLCFYYIMTGIHGIHIIVGIGCILWLVLENYRGVIIPESYSTVEIVSLYWHLVDAIWLFLMPLLYLAGAGMHH
jgi:cytochrome c oxidase subunit 3